eukprot:GHVN01019362.1.p1 GENE.GHVN01019362.1~~GHVN01019362.1.p1  ORF type:complete len:950 (+),score=235.94 GHVN01019362.1:1651-4500(+)
MWCKPLAMNPHEQAQMTSLADRGVANSPHSLERTPEKVDEVSVEVTGSEIRISGPLTLSAPSRRRSSSSLSDGHSPKIADAVKKSLPLGLMSLTMAPTVDQPYATGPPPLAADTHNARQQEKGRNIPVPVSPAGGGAGVNTKASVLQGDEEEEGGVPERFRASSTVITKRQTTTSASTTLKGGVDTGRSLTRTQTGGYRKAASSFNQAIGVLKAHYNSISFSTSLTSMKACVPQPSDDEVDRAPDDSTTPHNNTSSPSNTAGGDANTSSPPAQGSEASVIDSLFGKWGYTSTPSFRSFFKKQETTDTGNLNVDCPSDPLVCSTYPALGFSFSPAGLLGPYHLGVLACLIDNGYVSGATPLAGASAGALCATAAALGLSIADALDSVKRITADCRKNGTAYRLHELLKTELTSLLPNDSPHILANRKAHLTVTHTQVFPKLKGIHATEFESKDDLTNCLLASCNIPFFFSKWPTVKCRGRPCVDGYFAVRRKHFGCPKTASRRNIRVSPFTPKDVMMVVPETDCISPDLQLLDDQMYRYITDFNCCLTKSQVRKGEAQPMGAEVGGDGGGPLEVKRSPKDRSHPSPESHLHPSHSHIIHSTGRLRESSASVTISSAPPQRTELKDRLRWRSRRSASSVSKHAPPHSSKHTLPHSSSISSKPHGISRLHTSRSKGKASTSTTRMGTTEVRDVTEVSEVTEVDATKIWAEVKGENLECSGSDLVSAKTTSTADGNLIPGDKSAPKPTSKFNLTSLENRRRSESSDGPVLIESRRKVNTLASEVKEVEGRRKGGSDGRISGQRQVELVTIKSPNSMSEVIDASDETDFEETEVSDVSSVTILPVSITPLNRSPGSPSPALRLSPRHSPPSTSASRSAHMRMVQTHTPLPKLKYSTRELLRIALEAAPADTLDELWELGVSDAYRWVKIEQLRERNELVSELRLLFEGKVEQQG